MVYIYVFIFAWYYVLHSTEKYLYICIANNIVLDNSKNIKDEESY